MAYLLFFVFSILRGSLFIVFTWFRLGVAVFKVLSHPLASRVPRELRVKRDICNELSFQKL